MNKHDIHAAGYDGIEDRCDHNLQADGSCPKCGLPAEMPEIARMPVAGLLESENPKGRSTPSDLVLTDSEAQARLCGGRSLPSLREAPYFDGEKLLDLPLWRNLGELF